MTEMVAVTVPADSAGKTVTVRVRTTPAQVDSVQPDHAAPVQTEQVETGLGPDDHKCCFVSTKIMANDDDRPKTVDEKQAALMQWLADEEEKDAQFKFKIRESDYPNGDYDIVKACQESTLEVEEVVAAVQETKDTCLGCDVDRIGVAIFARCANIEFRKLEVTVPLGAVPGGVMLIPIEEGTYEGLHIDVIETVRDMFCCYVHKEYKPGSKVQVEILVGKSAPFTAARFIQLFAKDTELQGLVHNMESHDLNLLLKSDAAAIQKAIIDKFAFERDGYMNFKEWEMFADELRDDHINYFFQCALIKGKCYAGFGLTPGTEDPLSACFIFFFTHILCRGFFADFFLLLGKQSSRLRDDVREQNEPFLEN
jgi:hypothetical protein